jgi:mRNA-degrading endonuclease toxin of MazEF toxin-antitoxin module
MVDLRRPRSTLDDARVGNASMIMTYDRSRMVSRAGRVSKDALAAIDDALALHLARLETK